MMLKKLSVQQPPFLTYSIFYESFFFHVIHIDYADIVKRGASITKSGIVKLFEDNI